MSNGYDEKLYFEEASHYKPWKHIFISELWEQFPAAATDNKMRRC